jgi:hypothetical protein
MCCLDIGKLSSGYTTGGFSSSVQLQRLSSLLIQSVETLLINKNQSFKVMVRERMKSLMMIPYGLPNTKQK